MGGSAGAHKLIAALNKKYNLNLKLTYTPGPSETAMATRIRQEAKAKVPASSDVFIGGSSVQAKIVLNSPPAVDVVDWQKYFPTIPSKVIYQHRLLEASSRIPGIVYNTKLVPPQHVPHKLSDLLEPWWKGKVASTPYAAFFDTLASDWGYNKTQSFVKAYSKQISGLLRCGDVQPIISGQFYAYALACGAGAIVPYVKKGAPLAYSIPKDAVMVDHRYIGVPKTAKDKYAAILLTGFLLTRDGQNLYYSLNHEDNYQLPGAKSGKEVLKLQKQGIKVDNITPAIYKNPKIAGAAKAFSAILKGATK